MAGFVWAIGFYLVAGLVWPWWVNPLAQASSPLKVVLDALGTPGLSAVALLSMTLFGDAVIRVTSLLWSKWHRMVLMYGLNDVSTAESAKAALNSQTWLGYNSRTYSNRSLFRLIEEYERQRAATGLPPATSGDVRTLASNVIFMGPILLEVSDKRFVEQQRHNARFELASSLILGLPLLIVAVTVSLASGFVAGLPGYVAAVLCGLYAGHETHIAWRHSNSQIAHVLVDQKRSMEGISHNWDISRGLQQSLPAWLGRKLRREGTKSPTTQAGQSSDTQEQIDREHPLL